MIHLSVLDSVVRWGTNLEQTLAAAVKLHAEADAAGLTGAGELAEQGGEDGAGQCLLQQRGSCYHTGQITKSYTECASCGNAGPIPDYIIIPSKFWIYMCRTGKSTTLNILKKKKKNEACSLIFECCWCTELPPQCKAQRKRSSCSQLQNIMKSCGLVVRQLSEDLRKQKESMKSLEQHLFSLLWRLLGSDVPESQSIWLLSERISDHFLYKTGECVVFFIAQM